MQITFLGVGGAFAPLSRGNSNMMITSDSGKIMMVDFGTTAPYIYRDEMKRDFGDIDALYVTHAHADHVGGMELLAFHRYFLPKKINNAVSKIKLFCAKSLMSELWENTLRGGLESLQGKIMNMTDYFDCHPVEDNASFQWEGYDFTPIQTVHIRSGYIIKHSYGLAIRKIYYNDTTSYVYHNEYDAYITSDTMFDMGLIDYYNNAKVIFHDCETGSHRSIVHPNYEDLKKLSQNVRNKMWLYHHNDEVPTVKEDGFLGFVQKGQEFTI